MIAGGKPAEAVLVSRNVLAGDDPERRVADPQRETAIPLLDINVATPNGVSNHLLIKMEPSSPDRKPADEKTNAPHRVEHKPNVQDTVKPAEKEAHRSEPRRCVGRRPGEVTPGQGSRSPYDRHQGPVKQRPGTVVLSLPM